MLNRVPSPSTAQQHRVNGVNGGPAVTSVRVRATSTQTERPSTLLLHNHPAAMSSPVLLQSVKQSQLHISHFSQGTQTAAAAMTGPELSPEDNNNKVVGVGGVGVGGRALPRVVDASPKPPKLLSKLVDLAQGNGKVNGSGSSWGDPDEERPSVEGGRRSYSSRIPTPIKPTVIPVTTTLSVTPTGPSPSPSAAVNVNNYNYNNNNSSSSKALPSTAVATLAAATTPSKRELPDIPVMMTTPNKMATVHSTKSSPVTPQQLGSKLHHHHHLQQRGSKSEPANVPATTKVLPTTTSSTPSTEMQQQQLPQQQQQQQQTQSSVILHHPHHSSNHPRPVKSSFWGAWWKL